MANTAKAPVTIKWRKMEIPQETELLGVETDKNAEIVEFRMLILTSNKNIEN